MTATLTATSIPFQQDSSRRWYAMVYATKTGQVYGELPLIGEPSWLQQVNNDGTWGITTPIGGAGGVPRDTLRQIVAAGRFGVAVCYGTGDPTDYIAQAGPIWTYDYDEAGATLQLGGSGFWGLLKARLMVPATWNGTMAATASYGPDSLRDIAIAMLNDTITRGTLPLDVPAANGTGTETRAYPAYEMAMMGARLYELTQVDKGPDIVFQPYFAASNQIRVKALIGNPLLVQAGDPLTFDYGSNLVAVKAPSDGSKLATTVYVKGNGVETGTLFTSATDTTLTNAGWPLLEWVDSSHTSVADTATLQAWADADIALLGRPIETWKAVVRTDTNPMLGTYTPGVQGIYNITNHTWIPDGTYSQRILGLQSTSNVGEVAHILDAKQGVV